MPFAVESSLSGVQKEVGEKNELWYKRTFTVPSSWKGKDILLNFGAVDWKADVFVNDILIGSHTGGFTPFSLNFTPYLNGKSTHKLVVRVWDTSDKGYQPRGKQVANPEGIWYTPVTGIWQPVWLEPVASSHITSIKAIPNIDNGVMSVTVGACSDSPVSAIVEVIFFFLGLVFPVPVLIWLGGVCGLACWGGIFAARGFPGTGAVGQAAGRTCAAPTKRQLVGCPPI